MKVGLGLPAAIPGADMTRIGDWAAQAERRGFSSVGVIDRLVYDSLDPLTALAAAAACRRHVELVSTVVNVCWRNNPVLLAKQLGPVQRLSGGRLTVGLGMGGWPVDYEASGVPLRGRGRLFDAGLAALDASWQATGDRPRRVLIGGTVPAGFVRAARPGSDGWVAPLFGLELLREGAAAVHRAWSQAEHAGRPLIVTGRYVSLGPNAAATARRAITHYYGEGYADVALADTLTTEASVMTELRRLADAGCDHVLLFPCIDDLQEIERIADAVHAFPRRRRGDRPQPIHRKDRTRMTADILKARDFMATHARILDRRRFELLDSGADPAGVLAALDGYRNPDGGYSWGLEADLRCGESQPGAALHAFEVFEDVAPQPVPAAAALCDWLASITLPDGGLPMALAMSSGAGTAPWWQAASPDESSLQTTSVTAAAAWRVAPHDPAVARHPWLERATDYCLTTIAALEEAPFAFALAFSIQFLDAVCDHTPDAIGLLERLADFVPADGCIPITGGAPGEAIRPLDLAPTPNRPARRLFDDDVITADLDRLVAAQLDDGGWTVDHVPLSPAATLEWRGHATVRAIDVLQRNGVSASDRTRVSRAW